MLEKLSADTAALVRQWAGRLAHIGGRGIPGRSAILIAEGLAVSLAREARDGESLTLVGPDGREVKGAVQAWDQRTGLVLLAVPGLGSGLSAIAAAGAPAVGQLALTVAHPSPQGIEASLAMVRFSGGATDWAGVAVSGHFQTDGPAFPGFSGAAVVDATGNLLGVVTGNETGNEGWILPGGEWLRLVADLLRDGSWRQPWLGLSLMAVDLAPAQREIAGQPGGLVANAVAAGGPAALAGIVPGDLLLSIDGTVLGAVDSACCGGRPDCADDSCAARLPELRVGTASIIGLLRGEKQLELSVTPAVRPE